MLKECINHIVIFHIIGLCYVTSNERLIFNFYLKLRKRKKIFTDQNLNIIIG
jgi:hypothetical protein